MYDDIPWTYEGIGTAQSHSSYTARLDLEISINHG